MVDLKTPAGIILLVIILAAIPITTLFAPLAVQVVTGMVSTLFGALFMGVSRARGQLNTGEHPAFVLPVQAVSTQETPQ